MHFFGDFPVRTSPELAKSAAGAHRFRCPRACGLAAILALATGLAACTGDIHDPFTGDGNLSGESLTVGDAGTSVSGEVREGGTVRTMAWPISLPSDGSLTLELSWVNASAELDLQLRDASGYTIATSTRTSALESRATVELIPGDYEVVVRARSGRSSFTLDLAFEEAAGPVCGNGLCQMGEDCSSCMEDCGECPEVPPGCGDGECSGEGETCGTCADDCGPCPDPEPACGDTVCDAGENCSICFEDCGECPPPPPPPPPARDPVPSNAYCEPVAYFGAAATALEDQILVLVNQRRAAGANCGTAGSFGSRAPLTMNAALRCAARVHSLDMDTRDYFAHNSLDGTTPWTRMTRAGYAWSAAGENIAGGFTTAQGFVDAWMKSDGHCANIMGANFTHIGVGYYGNLGTQDFGSPQ
jgi:uncharacterized protein YkwD